MRRLIVLIVALLALPLGVSAREKRFGYCQTQLTGVRVKTCTVEVFITGTLSHPSQLYQDNLGTPLGNPFTASSSTGLWFFYSDNGRYDVKFSGGTPTISPPYTLSDLLFLDLGDATVSFSAQHFDSASVNIAQTGFIRMANLDIVTWRNSSNTFDWGLRVVGASANYPEALVWQNLPANTGLGAIVSGAFIQDGASATIAAAGALRLHSTDSINWRNIANTSDAILAKTGAASGNFPADTLYYENPAGTLASFSAGSFIEDGASASVAVAGFLRMHSSALLSWRNNANSADVSVGLTGAANGNRPADTFTTTGGAGGWWSNFYSAASLSAALSGTFRLGSSDTVCWRNTANTADLCMAKLGPNNFNLPGPLSNPTLQSALVSGTWTPVGTDFKFMLRDQGQCTMAAGTCGAQNFTGLAYAGPPLCFLTWTGTGALAGILKVASTTTTVTPSSSNGADTAQVNWACLGN